jgi:hypothetical protein
MKKVKFIVLFIFFGLSIINAHDIGMHVYIGAQTFNI